MLLLNATDDTLLDSPGSVLRVMSYSPKCAGSPGTPRSAGSPGICSEGPSPFSSIIQPARHIWFLKDKQAVVEEYELQGEPSFQTFTQNSEKQTIRQLWKTGTKTPLTRRTRKGVFRDSGYFIVNIIIS